MSDLGGSLERWLEWVNRTPLRATLFLILPVLVFVFGLGTWSYFWSGAAIREAVDAGLPPDAGLLWVTLYVGLTIPGFVFTACVALFAATRRWWSLIVMVAAFGLVVFGAAVNPSGVFSKTRHTRRAIESLTEIIGDAHVAEVVHTAVQSGKGTTIAISLLSIAWIIALRRRRRFADISSSHRAEADNRLLERHERRMQAFRWGYPVLVVVGVPLIALAGAANAA